MKDGEPIGFVEHEGSPEKAEINKAIEEAEAWIRSDEFDIETLKDMIETLQSGIDYAKEYELEPPKGDIAGLEGRLQKAEELLVKDQQIRNELIDLSKNFKELDWRQNLLEIRTKRLMKNDNFPKPVD